MKLTAGECWKVGTLASQRNADSFSEVANGGFESPNLVARTVRRSQGKPSCQTSRSWCWTRSSEQQTGKGLFKSFVTLLWNFYNTSCDILHSQVSHFELWNKFKSFKVWSWWTFTNKNVKTKLKKKSFFIHVTLCWHKITCIIWVAPKSYISTLLSEHW